MLRDLLIQAIDTCSALAGRDPNRDAVLTEPCGWPRAGAQMVPSRGRDISQALA
jgi:hypothetical protein